MSKVLIFSSSKYTPIFLSFKSLTYLRVSTVFLANLETDLVNIKSNLSLTASFIILMKPSLLVILVPLIPSSQ